MLLAVVESAAGGWMGEWIHPAVASPSRAQRRCNLLLSTQPERILRLNLSSGLLRT